MKDEDGAALGQEVARIAARHGDDPLALLAAGHAGLHFGDTVAGERALQRLVELEPDNVEACNSWPRNGCAWRKKRRMRRNVCH